MFLFTYNCFLLNQKNIFQFFSKICQDAPIRLLKESHLFILVIVIIFIHKFLPFVFPKLIFQFLFLKKFKHLGVLRFLIFIQFRPYLLLVLKKPS